MTLALQLAGALAFLLAACSGAVLAHEAHPPSPAAGARGSYAFPIATPGSYRLPPIKRAAGGSVLDEAGGRHELGQLLRGRTTVLALIYTRCGDVCPLATHDMARLQDLAAKDRRVAHRMRLVAMSFDPEHDTPQVMRAFAAPWRSAGHLSPEWLFLTAPDRDAIAPVLAGYDQRVDAKPGPTAAGGPLHHVFRAFLIDREGVVRNIYSLDFFDPDLVLNDIRTLLLEGETRSGQRVGVPNGRLLPAAAP